MGTLLTNLKKWYYFTGGGSFWPILWVILLYLYCSESDTKKMVTWFSDTVIVFISVLNDRSYSSTEIFVMIVCFMFGMYKNSVWIVSAALSSRAEFYINFFPQVMIVYLWYKCFIQIFMTILKRWKIFWRKSDVFMPLSILLIIFLCSSNSVGHGLWVMIFCCIFWNDEV